MRALPSATTVRCVLAVAALMGASASAFATTISGFEVRGRLAVSEPHSCDGGTAPDYLTTNSTVDWSTCHANKQHMDAAGTPITTNAFVADALRPLQVTIQLDAWCIYGSGGDVHPMASVRAQTRADGRFAFKVPKFDCGVPTLRPTGVAAWASAWLEYRIDESPGVPVGTVRALWDRTAAASVYTSILPADPAAWGDWIEPHLILGTRVLPVRVPSPVDFGDLTYFDGASPSYTGYLRGMLGAWQTMVHLHQRLQAGLAVDGHQAMHRAMFLTSPFVSCTNCYTVYFDLAGSGGMGGLGVIDLTGPDPSDDLWKYLSLVSVGLPGHEFGHSMHAAIAPGSWVPVDYAWLTSQDASGGTAYARSWVNNPIVQSQDMAHALLEGFGGAMGKYFTSGCHITDRYWGDPDTRHAWMNPAAYAACDATDPYCPYRFFRFQMAQRGIAEGSNTWIDRMKMLSTFASDASTRGATMVVSNNEGRVSNFLCDLLDNDPDVSYAAGQVGGRSYVVDYDWIAAEIEDGRYWVPGIATYASDPPPEMVTLTLGQMLEALQNFVPPLAYPGPLSSPIVDGAQASYDGARMSISGPYSSQSLARYLISRGWITRGDANGILSGNRMEELP